MWPTDYLFRKYPITVLCCVLTGMFIIAPLVDLAIDHEWFKRKAIEEKYCYNWNGDTIQPYILYKKGRGIKSFEKAYWMLAYYYTPDSLYPNKYPAKLDFQEEDAILKVEVLRYSEDSLLAKIRYKRHSSPSGYLEWVKIVPSFTLHDTLPTGYEAENEGYMKDIKLKKPKS